MKNKQPALVTTRIGRIGLLIGFSLIATLSVNADLDGANELSVSDADPGAAIESVDGTGLHNSQPAPLSLLSVDGTGAPERAAAPAQSTDAQPVSTFDDFPALETAQSIGCESADGEASDICGADESAPSED